MRFVTVITGGWDTHADNFNSLKNRLLPPLDKAWSALLDDLDQRGLLDTTVVICAGEFGRTPRVNGAAGRDHYAPCNVIGISGAGVKMGQVVGATDAKGEQVVGKSHSTLDYARDRVEAARHRRHRRVPHRGRPPRPRQQRRRADRGGVGVSDVSGEREA